MTVHETDCDGATFRSRFRAGRRIAPGLIDA